MTWRASAGPATVTGRSIRRRRSEKVQLVTVSEIKLPLGTMNSEPLATRTMLARMPMCLTTPSLPPNWIDIADFDRPLEEQDKARDKVVDDILQAEAQAHAEGAHQNRQARQVESQHGDANEEAERPGSRNCTILEME